MGVWLVEWVSGLLRGCLACCADVSWPCGGVHCWQSSWFKVGVWMAVFMVQGWSVDVCLQCMCGVGLQFAVRCCMEMFGQGWIVGLLTGFFAFCLMNWSLHECDQVPPLSSVRFLCNNSASSTVLHNYTTKTLLSNYISEMFYLELSL